MRDFFEKQFQNKFLWTPFLMAGGAAVYFTLSHEPSIPLPFILACATIMITMLRRTPIALRAILLALFGFLYACAFTNFINTPQMPRNLRDAEITGRVSNIDYTTDRVRIYLRLPAESIGANNGMATIRISTPYDGPIPGIGDTIHANAGLFRPGGADAPGAFDYARWAYFNGLSATGYINEIEITERATGGGINSLRNYLHTRADSFLSDGLVLGYKNALSKEERATWTTAGIGHVWSISGFHMTLVAGWLFALFYLIFRCIPYITRRVPARIPAMICAWLGLLFYLMISGINIATIRAFLMTSLIFLAFISGRNAISMRNLSIAFCIIFLINPHYVMQAGFQLSFAAVFGLIWFWGVVSPKMPKNKILKVITVAILTSVVATIFTTPFVAAHFNSVPLYGLIGNLILLPIFSVAIMPLVMLGTFTAPMGLHFPLDIADVIYNFTLRLADAISGMPFAAISTPHISNAALSLFIIGFLCLMFIKPVKAKINYIICGAFFTAGIIVIITTPRPVFYATTDHELVGFAENGKLEFNKSRASNHFFTFDTWKQMNGEATDTKNMRRKHENGVYKFETLNFRLAYIQKFVPLAENIGDMCRDDNIDYIVSYFDIRAPKCAHKILRDGFVIYKSGRIKYTPNARRWHNLPR